jgi:hypothetical protein
LNVGAALGFLWLLLGDYLVHGVTAVAGNRHAKIMAQDADSENGTTRAAHQVRR